MAYVQVCQSVVTHRKTLRLARLLNMDRYAVVGRLVAFWSWSLDNAPKGCLKEIEPDILADVLDYDGKPAELIEALLTAGFLDLDDQGHWWIHGWDETMLSYVEGKEKNAARMREARARERAERDQAGQQQQQQQQPQLRATHVQRTFTARANVNKIREEKSLSSTSVTDGEDTTQRERTLAPASPSAGTRTWSAREYRRICSGATTPRTS